MNSLANNGMTKIVKKNVPEITDLLWYQLTDVRNF